MIGFTNWRIADERVPYGKAKRTHCRHGHEYTPENTYWAERPGGARWRQCRTCGRERSSFRSRLYGLTLGAYQEMFTRQGGRCAICGAPPGKRALAVDHNHETGEVRALLCARCNVGIGGFRDDPELLAAAIVYLRSFERQATEPLT